MKNNKNAIRDIALLQLRGEKVGDVSKRFNISTTYCRTVLRRYCWRLDPLFYHSLREEKYSPVSIKSILSNANEFQKIENDNSPITLESPIWRIRELSTRAVSALVIAGIITVKDFLDIDNDRLKKIPRLGKISIQEVVYALHKNGIIKRNNLI